MSLWLLTRCCRSHRHNNIPTILFGICLGGCFGMFCFNRYSNKFLVPSSIGNVSLQRSSKFDFSAVKYRNTLQAASVIDQFSLWKNIVLPKEGERKAFSRSRHGKPLKLYFHGNKTIYAPKLVANLTVANLNSVLSNRQIKPFYFNGMTCNTLITFDNFDTKLPITQEYKTTTIVNNSTGCKSYIFNNGYVMSPITELEESFPLAFSILVYRDFRQLGQILRVIYRPQNFYCIHVDKKSEKQFTNSVRKLADCFYNVFVTNLSIDVRWGEFSVLEPELICMKELLKRHKAWKYFINLTGQEFPLRTNYELVKILDSINGANLVEGTIERANTERWKKSGPPPHGIIPVKGSIHVVLNRQFVDFAINNKIAKDLLDWSKKVDIPDELFFSTLHNNPQLNISGSYKGPPETNNETNPFLARFKNWEEDWPCKGKYVRGICVFGVGDLPLLATREELFANKFHIDYQPETLDCLEELLRNRTREETLGILVFNTTYYKTRDFVSKHVV